MSLVFATTFFFGGGGGVLRHSAVQTDFEFEISGSLSMPVGKTYKQTISIVSVNQQINIEWRQYMPE